MFVPNYYLCELWITPLCRHILMKYFRAVKNKILQAALIFALCTLHANAQLRAIEIKGKFGYIDSKGELVIPAIYDLALPFNDGHAVVALKLLPCLINEQNTRVIDTGIYKQIGTYSDGLCMVENYKSEKFYVNTQNEVVITLPKWVYEARPFNNGIAVVSKEVVHQENKFGREITTVQYRFGYINKKGETLTDLIYDDCSDFVDGYSRAIFKGKFGLIDQQLRIVIPFKYTQISAVSEQKVVVNDNGKFGVYVPADGIWLAKCTYRLILDYNDGMAAFIDHKNKYGFLNAEGKVAIKPQYINVKPFSEGKAGVLIDGKWGFISKQNELVIRPLFDNVAFYSEGLCPVQIKRRWGYINTAGKFIIPAEYDITGAFLNGIAPVVFQDVAVYITRKGEIVPKLRK
jgi:hypothetical protein